MIDLYEATVFCDADGNFGDKHGIIIDEASAIDWTRRLAIAARLGYAETIFINDITKSDVSFFARTNEIPFAGTAALAVAKLLDRLTNEAPAKLVSQGNDIIVEFNEEYVWVEASTDIMPPWNHVQLHTAYEVDAIKLDDTKELKHTMFWAWVNENESAVRARTFASDWLLPEVEANGSGSMVLAASLSRAIDVVHGKGSRILAEPKTGNIVRLGGRVRAEKSPIKSIDV